jgi:CheY-like chemotaxis protein
MGLTSARVLLVEDNIELAENVREILEDVGCKVVHAYNGV